MLKSALLFIAFGTAEICCCIAGGNDSTRLVPFSQAVSCFQRPKFFEVKYSTLPAVKEYPIENARGDERFEGNRLIDAHLNIPIFLKPDFKLVSRIHHKNETLKLGENNYIDKNIGLYNTGVMFLYQWFYKDDYFVAGHLGMALKSDRYDINHWSSMTDYNTSILIGRDNGEQILGIGVAFGNSMGRLRILPALTYSKQLGDKWNINAFIPKEANLTYRIIPDNFYLTMALEGSGATYFIRESALNEFPPVEFRRRAIDLRIGLEKEIRDWLWVGAYAGATQPLRSVLVEGGQPSRKYVHNFRQKTTPFVNFSVFMVPPRALYNKFID